MNSIRKLIVALTGISLLILFSILVMIHGWGLSPKSYWWIIGVGTFGQLLALTITHLSMDND